jgi:hypothetical protein
MDDTGEADRIKSVRELPECYQAVYNGCFRCTNGTDALQLLDVIAYTS